MEFILKGKAFAIKSAELSATIMHPHWRRKYWAGNYHPVGDTEIFWTLEVWADVEMDDGEADDGEPGGEVCPVRATAEEMRFPVRRWVDVVGRTVEWAPPHDEKAGGPYGCFYLGEHEMISRARLRFTGRDGTAFRFEWDGVCNAYLDGEYRRDVPFSTAGWARFTGVNVQGSGADTDESMRGRLAQHLDPRDYVQGPLLSRSYRGRFFRRVTMSHAVFTPSDTRAA